MIDWPSEKDRITARMKACKTIQQLHGVWIAELPAISALGDGDKPLWHQVVNLKEYLKAKLIDDPAMQSPPMDYGA